MTRRAFFIVAAVATALLVLAGCPANPFWGLEPNPVDDEGPAVTILNPEEGQAVSGSLYVTGLATDKYAIASVSLQLDSDDPVLLDGTYVWNHVIDTTVLTEGSHTVTIIAADQFDNTSFTSVGFDVDQTVPSVNPVGYDDDFADYENYIRGTDHVIEIIASDDTGIARLQITFNGGLTFEDATWVSGAPGEDETWTYTIADTSTLRPGDGRVDTALRAYDNTGVLFGSSNYSLWVDNTAPILQIDSPIDGTSIDSSEDLIANILPVSGEVNDELVAGLRRVTVQIGALNGGVPLSSDADEVDFIDDNPSPAVNGTFSADYALIGTEVDEGPLTITVTAEDKAGNSTSATVDIALDDSPPTFESDISTSRGTLDSDLSTTANNFSFGTFTFAGTVGVTGGLDTLPASIQNVQFTLIPTDGGSLAVDTPVDTQPYDATGAFSHDLVIPDDAAVDGNYDLVLRVTNVRGGFVELTEQLRIDTTGATATIIEPAAPYMVTGTAVAISGQASVNVAEIESIRIQIEDTDSGVPATDDLYTAPDFLGLGYTGSYYTYLWDSTDYSSVTPDQPVITLTVTDLAGNESIATVTTTIDPDAPTVEFDSYEHPGGVFTNPTLASDTWVNGSGTIYGTATDDQSFGGGAGTGEVTAVDIAIDTGGYTTVGITGGLQVESWDYVLSDYLPGALSEGDHTIYVRVTDNESATSTSSIVIHVDNTPPSLDDLSADVTDGSGTSYLHGLAAVTGTAADAGAGVLNVALTVDDTDELVQVPETLTWDLNEAFTVDWDTELLPTDSVDPIVASDTIDLVVTVTDAAGNATTQTLSALSIGPYITSLGKNYAYLGETGLTIAGDNLTNGTADPTVTVGGGDINYDTLDGVGGVSASTVNSVTFSIDSDYTAIDPLLSSGPVIVTFNGVDNSEQYTIDPDLIKMDLFAVQTLNSDSPYYPDAVFNPDLGATGEIASAFGWQSGGDRYVAYQTGTGSRIDLATKGGSPYAYVHLDYDANSGVTYVSYLGANLTVVWSDSEFWNGALDIDGTYTVTEAGSYNDIVVDSAGVAHLVYYSGGELRHRSSADGFASYVTIDGASSDAGAWLSLAAHGSADLHVVYYDATSDSLMYAYSSTAGASWDTPRVVESPMAGEYGNGIAVDSSGGIHVSFYENNSGDLRYAYATGPTADFATEVADSSGLTGWFSSIAVDGDGFSHITSGNFTTLKPRYSRQIDLGGGVLDFDPVTIGEPSDYDINNNSSSTATLLDGSGNVHMIYTTTGGDLRDAIYLPED